MTLREQCIAAVGKQVAVKGTWGDERKSYYGGVADTYGTCLSYHDSHGLCIMLLTEAGNEVCIDPTHIEILE